MTTTTIVPNAVVAAGSHDYTVVGASVVAALTDASDSTYVALGVPGTSADLILDFGTFTLPAGAVILLATNKYRAAFLPAFPDPIYVYRQTSSSFAGQPLTATPTNFTNTYTISSVTGAVATQADIDGYQLHANNDGGRLYEVSVDIKYALVPSVVVTAPPSIAGTTSPTVAWTHTPGSDAQTGQTKYQVRVFSAAEYGIGGFNPATSPASYDSGIVPSNAASAVSAPLSASLTYRAYVSTAQTTNGVDQWAPWAFTQFSFNVTPPRVATVVATPNNTTGTVGVTVTRDGTGLAWESVGLEASYDGGVTWNPVRGTTGGVPITDPNTFTATDYEAPNGKPAQYRARATRTVGGTPLTSDWVLSNVVTWTADSPCQIWLKDPSHPSRNIHLDAQMPDVLYDRTVGVFRPVGAFYPVVVSDVLQAGTSTITVVTRTDAEAAALHLIATGTVLLLQTPASAGWQWGSRYVAPGALQETHTSPAHLSANRVWTLALVEVARPPDEGLS